MRCDSHVHIVGGAASWPQIAERSYLAAEAPLTRLLPLAAARGVSRFVIVQPSFYGDDNTLLLRTLDTLGRDGRGVVMVDPARVQRRELEDMARRGARGLRFNPYSPGIAQGAADAARLAALIELAGAMGWHVEIVSPLPGLLAAAPLLARARAPIVIDHFGLPGDLAPEDADARALISLLREPHVWMKLSAPYRMGRDPLAIAPDRRWLDALLRAAPDRCVWGSDWPHTPAHETHRGADIAAPYRDLSYAAMVDAFLATLASPDLARAALIDNPARLYGFG